MESCAQDFQVIGWRATWPCLNFHSKTLSKQLISFALGVFQDIVFLQSWEKTKRKKAERRRLGVRWVNRDPFLTARLLDPSRSSDLFGSEEYSNRVSVDWDEETKLQHAANSF